MATRIYGIRITLDDAASPVTPLAAIGLRNVALSNSEILIAQNSVVGAPEWAANALSEDGIGDWGIGYDSLISGAIAKLENVNVSLKNTGLLQKEFSDRGISLTGLVGELVEITGTTVAVLQTGKVEQPQWDAVKYSFVIRADANSRDAKICSDITKDIYPYADTAGTVPATFGELRPVVLDGVTVPIYAKAVRVAAEVEKWSSGATSGFRNPQPTNLVNYPIDTVTDDVTYGITLVASYDNVSGSIIESELVGKHLFVVYDLAVSGISNKGFYREITAATSSYNRVDVTIKHPFPKRLALTSIVQILDVQRQFAVDAYENNGQIKDDGTALDSNPLVYLYDEKYDRLPESLAEIEGSTGKTILSVDSKSIEGDVDSIKSCVAVPFKSVKLLTDPVIVIDSTTFNKSHDGYYKTVNAGICGPISTPVPANAIDRDGNTYMDITTGMVGLYAPITDQYAAIVECEMPDVPENITFEKLYVGVKASMDIAIVPAGATNYAHKMDIYYKFWTGTQTVIKQIAWGALGGLGTEEDSVTLKNLPTWYYKSNPPASDSDYYKVTTPVSVLTYPADVTGYKEAEILQTLESTDNNTYGSVSSILIVFRFTHFVASAGLVASYLHTVKLYDAGLMFYINKTISDAIYTPNKGRIFGSTWGTRKTAANMVTTPREMAELACRLQCYSDLQAEPTAGWGKALATAAKIKTSGNGSFDAASLSSPAKPAFQLFDTTDGTTERLKQIICREYTQMMWVDKDGYECIDDINLALTGPAISLTYGDITDPSSIQVTPPDAGEIYCEPVIRFNKNYATGEYQSSYAVTNSAAASYVEGYVKGMTGAVAEAIWNRCHALWLKCRVINEMPSELSDMITANGPGCEFIAMRYLYYLTTTMGLSKISMTYPNDLVSSWDCNQRFIQTLAHQTAGVATECLLKSRRYKTKEPFDCEVEAYMIATSDVPALIEWQKTYATGTEYQKTYATGTVYQRTY